MSKNTRKQDFRGFPFSPRPSHTPGRISVRKRKRMAYLKSLIDAEQAVKALTPEPAPCGL